MQGNKKITDTNLPGPEKAAILLVAMGSQASSKIFQKLHPEEVEILTKEI